MAMRSGPVVTSTPHRMRNSCPLSDVWLVPSTLGQSKTAVGVAAAIAGDTDDVRAAEVLDPDVDAAGGDVAVVGAVAASAALDTLVLSFVSFVFLECYETVSESLPRQLARV